MKPSYYLAHSIHLLYNIDMSVKQHYDNHLGNFYSWMIGDLKAKQAEQLNFFRQHNILPATVHTAIDLGAGNGLHAIPLAKLGFNVTAIDFNPQLLAELTCNAAGHNITIINDDIRNIKKYTGNTPGLIICMGDTLTHLESMAEIQTLIMECCESLADNGKLILSFRDYSVPLHGNDRFIPVKNDDDRIFTCFLEYFPHHVTVTDILYERAAAEWEQKISSYNKVRLQPVIVETILQQNGMHIIFNEPVARLHTIVAVRGSQ